MGRAVQVADFIDENEIDHGDDRSGYSDYHDDGSDSNDGGDIDYADSLTSGEVPVRASFAPPGLISVVAPHEYEQSSGDGSEDEYALSERIVHPRIAAIIADDRMFNTPQQKF